MRTIYRLIAILYPLLLVGSCAKEIPYKPSEAVRLPFTVFCRPLDTAAGQEPVPKSLHSAESLEKISNLNYYLFRNGELVGQKYFANCLDLYITLPTASDTYNLYILANTGQYTISSSTRESDMATTVHVDYISKEYMLSTISTSGFPMSAKIMDFTAESVMSFSLRRLVHTLYVKINTENLSTTEMKFTGLSVKQAARDIFPFAEESKAQFVMEGDAASLSNDDLERLNAGKTVTLYMLENMRGTLIPGNTSWKTKTPDRIQSSKERALASYIEITSQAKTVTASYENNIYRAYLGCSPSDFNVRGNTIFTMSNNFTNDMIVDEGWRIESDTPNITAKLAFVDTRYTAETAPLPNNTGDSSLRPFRDIEGAYIMDKFSSVYYIYKSDPRIEYDLSVEQTNAESHDYRKYVNYKISRIDDHFMALLVSTTYPIDMSGPYYKKNPDFDEGKSVTFKIKSKDGLIEDRLLCKVLTYPLGLRFRYDGVPANSPVTDDGKLNMYFCNPLGLAVQASVEGKIWGACVVLTGNGENKTEFSTQVRTGNLYHPSSYGQSQHSLQTVVPITGKASRIDNYDKQSQINQIGGFYEYFKAIWNNTVFDMFASDFKRHAHPAKIEFKIDIKCRSVNSDRVFPHNFSGNTFQLPIHFENMELTKGTSALDYKGAGTDFGFIWHQYDDAAESQYTTYKFVTSASSIIKLPGDIVNNIYYDPHIDVSINNTKKWTTDGIGLPFSETYNKSNFQKLGFSSYK